MHKRGAVACAVDGLLHGLLVRVIKKGEERGREEEGEKSKRNGGPGRSPWDFF
jgi:hypothetical protein